MTRLYLFIVALGILTAVVFSPFAASAEEVAATSSPIHVSVDRRVELTSLLFRLAGNPEYNQGRIKNYTNAAEKQFGTFRDHAAVKRIAALRRGNGVSFDAAMSMAVRLPEGYIFGDDAEYTTIPAGLESRWPVEQVLLFLEETRGFVRESGFNDFFKDNQRLYDATASRMIALLEANFRRAWFDKFYGERPNAEFRIILGMLNGGNCYGASTKVGERETLYSILGVWSVTLLGSPTFDAASIPTIVHEFTHSYANPLVDRHAGELEAAGRKIFEPQKERFERMAYGNWKTVLYESLVRACVIRYIAAENPIRAELSIATEQGRGFLWMRGLVDLLREYEANREKCPNLEAFMPRIVEFFNDYARSLDAKDSAD